MLVLPLFVLVGSLLAYPLISMVIQSVYDPVFGKTLPRTATALAAWDRQGTAPDQAVIAEFIGEIAMAHRERRLGGIVQRLDFEAPGMGGLVSRAARAIAAAEDAKSREVVAPRSLAVLAEIDPAWRDHALWATLARCSSPWTLSYLARAFDYRVLPDGSLALAQADARPHTRLFSTTFLMAGAIVIGVLLVAYPLAYYLTTLPPARARWLLLLVMLPMWVSLMVRASAWVALLQSQGVVNDFLVAIGFVADQSRLQLVYNLTGTLIVMSHFMLPSMVLPLYTSMLQVPRSLVRAASSLGARPWRAFWEVYFPSTLPGVSVACLMGFISAIGFYIIPALVGGASGQFISSAIANYTNKSMNYGLASALSTVMLVAAGLLFALYSFVLQRHPVPSGAASDLPVAAEPARRSAGRSVLGRAVDGALVTFSWAVIAVLVLPLLVIIPISFSAQSAFSFTPGMLMLDSEAWSLRWYRELLSEPRWQVAFFNSLWVAVVSAAVAVAIAILGALGLSRPELPFKRALGAALLLPSVAPIVAIASGLFLLYTQVGLLGSMFAVVLSHIALIAPPTVFTIQAAMAGVPPNFARAAASVGASPWRQFADVTFPMMAPGVVAAALLAFLGSFDEPVIVQFITFSPEQFTFPRQMVAGLQEEVTPVILAACTLMLSLCVILFGVVEVGRAIRKRHDVQGVAIEPRTWRMGGRKE